MPTCSTVTMADKLWRKTQEALEAATIKAALDGRKEDKTGFEQALAHIETQIKIEKQNINHG